NADGSFTYTPVANYNGSDGFRYQIYDGTALSNIATVSLTVNAVEDAPLAANDTYRINEGAGQLVVAAAGVLANDRDADGDPITAALVSGPANGTLSLAADGSFTYTPGPGFSTTDSFTYVANDGILSSNVATVTINLNRRPVAAADSGYVATPPLALSVAAP